jgi:hypothetical protein
MTGRVSLDLMNGCGSKKNLTIGVIATAALITAMITLAPISERSINAQTMGDHEGSRLGNMTSKG